MCVDEVDNRVRKVVVWADLLREVFGFDGFVFGHLNGQIVFFHPLFRDALVLSCFLILLDSDSALEEYWFTLF